MTGGMLKGVRVVDLTSVVIGPLCTQILADHGADVIKVESPEGDICRYLGGLGKSKDMGPKFLHLNRNKRSICLDLKSEEGRRALLKLIATADVLCWNIRPGSMARLGLTYEEVRAVKPDIIYCGMFGFGRKGEYADIAAYDPIIQGVSGVAALMERAFGEPRFVPYVLADRTTGLIAVQMIAMALFYRERTGLGQEIDVPMFENMATQVLTEHLYLRTYVQTGSAQQPTGDPRLVSSYYTPIQTSDGYISLTANTNNQVFPLFDAMGLAHLKEDPRFDSVTSRFANTDEYFRIRAEGIRQKDTAFWMEVCKKHDIPAAPYHTLESLLDDPHLSQVGFFVERQHPSEGKILDLAPANTNTAGTRSDWLPAPRLGQHTKEILLEAGLAESTVDELLASGAAQEHIESTPRSPNAG